MHLSQHQQRDSYSHSLLQKHLPHISPEWGGNILLEDKDHCGHHPLCTDK